VKDRKLVDAKGQQLGFTILLSDPSLERPTLPYIESLKKLGIDVRARTVDPAQYQRLTDEFDLDMTMMVYPQGDIPGTELRDYWSCAAAKAQGSSNVSGICDPAVDALIDKVVNATDRETLTEAARALDRILLWRNYAVPNWGSQQFNIAWWDRFSAPDQPIREGFNFDLWWVDPAKAAATDAAKRR
jgi:microcin C transport system substrate-binding protein